MHTVHTRHVRSNLLLVEMDLLACLVSKLKQDFHVELGSITFESGVEDTGCKLNECYLSRNLFRDEGPLVCTWSCEQQQDEEEEEEDEQEEQTKRAVVMRYDQFRAMFGDMLDPALEEEFKTMQQMGLPTMLINSYGDMGEGDEDVVPQKPHQGRNHRRGHHSSRAARPPSRRPVEDRSRAEDMNKSWRREDDTEQSWRTAEDVDTSGGEKDTNDTGPAVEEDSTSLDIAQLLSDEEGCGIEDGDVVDEVVCGQAAGMPGRWVEVVHEEQQSSSTEELLTALHLKAQAFADNGWQEYWTSAGPSHLAQSWSQQYPSIPLNKVECVCGVDFLCQTMETQMSLNSTVPAEEHQNTLESDCPPLDDEEAEPNDHEILAMWNELYNNQYWFIYSWYRGDQPLQQQQQQDDDTVDMDQQLDQQPNTNQVDNSNKADSSFSDRTLKRCQSMGFSLKEKEEYNPHRRWVRVAAVKLLQSTGNSWPGRHHLMNEALSAVGHDGRLMAKRRQKNKEARRKNRKKKKKGKSGSQSAVEPANTKERDEEEEEEEEAAVGMSGEEDHDTKQEEEDSSTREENMADNFREDIVREDTRDESMADSTRDESMVDSTRDESMADSIRKENIADSSQEDIADTSQEEIIPDGVQEEEGMMAVGDVAVLAGEPLQLSTLLPPLLSSAPPRLAKYWSQRYRIFSKYDEGVRMDQEGWFSATPEKIAAHIAERCQCDLIVDAFCGVGSNAIQFAFTCERVIAIDIDPVKVACARHNAELYGVADRIEFIVGDYFTVLPQIKCADVVFLSPPWGGPSYSSSAVFSLHSMVPLDGLRVFEVARKVTPHIAYYLPRNIDITELVSAVPSREAIEVEQHFLNKKFKTVTAYFGELVEQQEDHDEEGLMC